ncbi:DUF3253 domain-containing protein [Sphingomonas sp. ZB1N12]|uniref:DUF3253 domain-containing protein n=1 Tax=Sphingomonas arabinosi TaxID=3096160 RepID=UPI002FC748B9
MTATNAQEATLALLASRASTATVCPSEVARVLANAAVPKAAAVSWRDLMPVVHAAVDRLVIDGHVRLSWKGQALPTRSGPYRIGRV